MAACLDENVLADLIDGRLRLQPGGAIEEHLATCSRCAQLVGAAVSASGTNRPSHVPPRQWTPGRQSFGGPTLSPTTMLRDTYKVIRLLGRGGMGEVYEVSHVRLSGRYAIKVLPADVSHDEELLARFRREAEITSGLRHPNIVQVIDFDRTEDGCVFLAMEYLDGRDLRAVLRDDAPLPLSRVVAIIEQIGSALTAAHRKGIIHRDLKPENVFVLRDDNGAGEHVKLVDFGLSKWSGPERERSLGVSRDQVLIGTPRYMAPEQAHGKNHELSPATDQFALAAIAYEMLAGRAAFEGDTLAMILHAIAYDEPPRLGRLRTDLPFACGEVIARALSKSPKDRYESVAQFVAALRDATIGSSMFTSTARSSSHAPAPVPARRRSPVLVASVAAVVVIGAAAIALVRDREAPPVARSQQQQQPQPVKTTTVLLSPTPPAPAPPAPAPEPAAIETPRTARKLAARKPERRPASLRAPDVAEPVAPPALPVADPPKRKLDLIERL